MRSLKPGFLVPRFIVQVDDNFNQLFLEGYVIADFESAAIFITSIISKIDLTEIENTSCYLYFCVYYSSSFTLF